MNNRASRWGIGLFLAIGLAGVTGCGSSPTAAPKSGQVPSQHLTPLTIGYPAPAATFAVLFVAQQQGFFRKNGLQVSLKVLSGSGSETAALLSGSAQAIVANGDSVLPGIGKGASMQFIGSAFNVYPYQVWAQPSIGSVSDLKGKALGETQVNSAVAAAAQQLFSITGISPGSVQQDYLGANNTELAGLLAGKVNAAILVPPLTFEAQAKGFKLLYPLTQVQTLFEGLVVTRSFIQQHPTLVTGLLKSYVEAAAYTKNPQNKAAVMAAIGKVTHTTNSQLLAKTYQFFVPLFPVVPNIPRSEFALSQQWVAQHAHVSVHWSQAVDLQPLQALNQSGFLKAYETATPQSSSSAGK